MARIELAAGITEDFDRIINHLMAHEAARAEQRVDTIIAALDVLATSPLIGRTVDGATRELVIGHGAHGYVALYQYLAEADVVLVLAIRSQREAGYHSRAD